MRSGGVLVLSVKCVLQGGAPFNKEVSTSSIRGEESKDGRKNLGQRDESVCCELHVTHSAEGTPLCART